MDRDKLLYLRVQIGLAAQRLHVETKRLPVLGKSYDEIHNMAETNEVGWGELLDHAVNCRDAEIDRWLNEGGKELTR